MSLTKQLTFDERQSWDSFIQRLGAGQRLKNLVLLLDGVRKIEDSELADLKLEVQLLNQLADEYTIIVMHRDRQALMC